MKMVKFIKILIPGSLFIFAGLTCYSQSLTVTTDTAKVNQKKTESTETVQNQNQNKNKNQNQYGSSQNSKGNQAVKQVKSARPDMSKAKGARPNIVRPSGSSIPRGVGKPAGAGRSGGR